MVFPWWFPVGRVAEVAAKVLHEQLKSDAAPQLVDVRQPSEYRAGHIRGAVNVPIGAFTERLPELGLDPQRPIVAICLTAHRSIPAVRLLRQAGFRRVYQLGGGMLAWRLRSYPEERSAG
jgi:rhodanese-related sulfurtransferase